MPIAAALPPLEAWVAVYGRMHPLLLHAPIGFLSAVALLEAWLYARRRRPDPGEPTGMRWVGVERAIGVLAWVSAFSALLTAGAGLVLAQEDDYVGGSTLGWHRNLGLAVAGGALLLALTHGRPKLRNLYCVLIGVTLGLLGFAGHFGAELTHGAGFLTEPLQQKAPRAPRTNTKPAAANPTASGASAPTHASTSGAATTPAANGAAGANGATGASGTTGVSGATTAGETATASTSAPSSGAKPTAAHDALGTPNYRAQIAPILEMHCAVCHGERKRKGGLDLHTPAGIQSGSGSGPVLVAGNVDASELIRRMRLPLDDDAHMPPDGKLQPSDAMITWIEDWIRAGAPFEDAAQKSDTQAPAQQKQAEQKPAGSSAAPNSAAAPDHAALVPETGGAQLAAHAAAASSGAAASAAAANSSSTADASSAASAASSAALEALRTALVHVQPRAAGSDLLWIDTAAVAPSVDDARAQAWLAPLAGHVAELSLARTQVGDASAALFASMPQLARLDLSATRVGPATLRALSAAPRLEELVLTRAKLAACSASDFSGLRALKTLRVWNSGITDAVLAQLRAERPELVIDDGDGLHSKALETEAALVLTSDAPLPGAAAAPVSNAQNGAAATLAVATEASHALDPINAKCPVSGSPVKREYSVVWNGKVVGFCCPNCPKTFWDAPESFAAKLH